MRSREERSQFFDTNIGPGSALLAEENDLFINDSHYDKVILYLLKTKIILAWAFIPAKIYQMHHSYACMSFFMNFYQD